jgi:C-3',4' desaturase CrtD
MQYDVVIVGGGIAGMATAARLQSAGLSTFVLESHTRPGGCAGYYCRDGFAFDVGATTLVDFEPGGVGGELLESIGMSPIEGEALPGYVAWLPDRRVMLHRDRAAWNAERLRTLGDSTAHRQFWRLIDSLADAFWPASRRGVKLPIRSTGDVLRAVRCVGLRNLSLGRYCNSTLGDILERFRLRGDRPLVGVLSMLIEDTVHSTVDRAPLINAALGMTIRGAGLTRPRGGMRLFWRSLVARYRAMGGMLCVRRRVTRITGSLGGFEIETSRGCVGARQVVSATPALLAARLGPRLLEDALAKYLRRDAEAQGGAIVVFLGTTGDEVEGEPWTHHQLLQDYDSPLGNGNNMFVSVSAAGDLASAPRGYRAVMISTHCELADWQGLEEREYQARKQETTDRLIDLARRVYPRLGERAAVCECATPVTFERFTQRPRGAVGGVRQTIQNSNQSAIPHDLGPKGVWLVGDSTWPGLGTVACVLSSRIVAEDVLRVARRLPNCAAATGNSAQPRHGRRRASVAPA